MNDSPYEDPTPYIELKQKGGSVEEVYIRARKDGFKNFQCLILICEIFSLELHEARKIAHSVFHSKK